MNWAAIWGTSVHCEDFGDSFLVENHRGGIARINNEVFNKIFVRLDEFTAALKEDCIEYTVYQPNKPLSEYPDWFINAYYNGDIFEVDYGTFIFYEENGDLAMSPGSIVLRNFRGELKYMESNIFEKYYDTLGRK